MTAPRPAQRVLLLALALPMGAHAVLGASIDSVSADALGQHATRRVEGRAAYVLHQLTLPSGTVVREFATYEGEVFAVSWQGPIKPDLQQLLGPHFPRLVSAAHGGARRDHRQLRLQADDLVIESGGRMRAFAGRAYLPALMPAGVSPAELR